MPIPSATVLGTVPMKCRFSSLAREYDTYLPDCADVGNTVRVRPRSIYVAVAANAAAAVVGSAGGVWMLVTARTLAVHAHGRDDHVSERVYSIIFRGLGTASIVVATIAAFSAWALWQGKRWAWWVLVVLTALGSLSVLRPQSVWGAITIVPVVVALVALLLPTSRDYVRRVRTPVEAAPDPAEPWSGQPAAYATEDQWLQGR